MGIRRGKWEEAWVQCPSCNNSETIEVNEANKVVDFSQKKFILTKGFFAERLRCRNCRRPVRVFRSFSRVPQLKQGKAKRLTH